MWSPWRRESCEDRGDKYSARILQPVWLHRTETGVTGLFLKGMLQRCSYRWCHEPLLHREEVVICGWLTLLQHRTFLSLPFFFCLLAVRAAAVSLLKGKLQHDRILKGARMQLVTAQPPSDARVLFHHTSDIMGIALLEKTPTLS